MSKIKENNHILSVSDLARAYLKVIVKDGWLCNISTEGFDTYYDMSGQRTCKLVKTFDNMDLDVYPLLLGLVRADYFCFYKEQGENITLFKGGTKRRYYRDELKKPVFIGQVIISEDMLKDVSVTLKHSVVIKFKSFELRACKNPRHEHVI